MPAPIKWSAAMDAIITDGRTNRKSWDHIASLIGVARYTCIERGRAIGVTQPDRIESYSDPDRAPLAAGSAETWGAITSGTCLEGAEYPPHVPLTIPRARLARLLREAQA